MKELTTLNVTNTISMAGMVKDQARKYLKQTAILGLGNELQGDKGIGVHAVRQLKEVELPKSAKVVEVGTAILDTLLALKHAERIIVLDSMRTGGTPGTVYRIPFDHYAGTPCIASMDGYDIFREMVLTGRKRMEPPSIMVFGVEPETTDWSMTLSPTITKSLPYLLEVVRKELRS
ncbi:MAG: hydrogenase maturation protease [Desulfobulbaceae bacterium]|nr:hydrogenase maturation protease [Desulfobulbaceae bacterium]